MIIGGGGGGGGVIDVMGFIDDLDFRFLKNWLGWGLGRFDILILVVVGLVGRMILVVFLLMRIVIVLWIVLVIYLVMMVCLL